MKGKNQMLRSSVYAVLILISLPLFLWLFWWGQVNGDPSGQLYLDLFGWLLLFPVLCIALEAFVLSLLEKRGCLSFTRKRVLRWILGAAALLFLCWQVLNVWDMIFPLHIQDFLTLIGFKDPTIFVNWITHYTKAPYAALVYQILGGMIYYAF